MASGTLISVEEYLSHTYRPDCDYVDGELLERNLGERDHSGTQGEIVFYLRTRYPHLKWKILPEQRVQVLSTRFRIPDVCVLAENAPREKIIRTPPALCIEILSKDDRMTDMMTRVGEYLQMGVPVCWIVDPVAREGHTATPGRLVKTVDGILRAGLIEMPLNEVLEPLA